MSKSFLKVGGKGINYGGKPIIIPKPIILTVYEGDMTIGTYTFMTVTSYGFNPGWATPGSLNPANGDISNIYWASNTEKIYFSFVGAVLNLGTVEIDDVEIEFEIFDTYGIRSVPSYSSNPFNGVGEISTIKISYKIEE